MQLTRLLPTLLGGSVLAAFGLLPQQVAAQTPAPLFPSGTYSENFEPGPSADGINTWASNFASPTRATRFSVVATSGVAGSLTTAAATNVTQATVFATSSGGGVQKTSSPYAIALLASGGGNAMSPVGNAAAFDLRLNFTNASAGSLTFDWAKLINTANDANPRQLTLLVYTSPDGTTWSAGTTITTVNNNTTAETGSSGSLALPASFDGDDDVYVRFYAHNIGLTGGSGSRPKISIDNIVVNATVAAGGSPAIALTPNSAPLTTPNTPKGTPSAVAAAQSFSVSGTFLTSGGNLTASVLAGAPFEIATTAGGTYGSSVTFPITGTPPTASATGTVFVRLNSATAGTFNAKVRVTGGGAPADTLDITGKAQAVEPTAQPTITVSAPTPATLSVNITPQMGSGSKYLVVYRAGSSTFTPPADGTTYTVGSVISGTGTVGAIATGAGPVVISGLLGNTVYNVRVYSFEDDGQAGGENYRSGAPASGSATTPVPLPSTYTWDGSAGNGLWSDPTNWTPDRTPQVNDILVFSSNANVTVDFATSEAIAQLKLQGTAQVTLNTNAVRTLNINDDLTNVAQVAGNDLVVPAGAKLSLLGTTTAGALTIALGAGASGQVAGTVESNGIVGQTGTSRLSATTAASLDFISGSEALQGSTPGSGSFFGGSANSVDFQNGATFRQLGGSNPFGSNALALAPESNFIYNATGAPSLSNRTYGNIAILSLGTPPVTIGGSGTLTVNDLTVSAGVVVTLNTGGAGLTIGGNLTVDNGTMLTLASGNALPTNVTFTGANPVIVTEGALVMTNLTLSKSTPGNLVIDYLTVGAAAVTLDSPVDVTEKVTLGAANLVSNGNLTLISFDGSSAALVENAGAGIVTGAATVQRATDGSAVGYRHYASPVSGNTVADLATPGFVPVVNGVYNTAMTPANVRPYPNVFGFDATRVLSGATTPAQFAKGWYSPAPLPTSQALTQPLEQMRGYSVYLSGTRVVDFTGILRNGSQSFTLAGNGTTSQGGWNLTGNPYPAGLDWETVTIPTGMALTASLWSPSDNGTIGGSYEVLLQGGPNFEEAPSFNKIALGQGFFVKKITSAGTVVFTTNNSNRLTSAEDETNSFNRAATLDQRPATRLTLTANALSSTKVHADVYFDANATAGLDYSYDAPVPGRSQGSMPTLLTLVGNDEIAINGLPALTGADVLVPMLIVTPLAGSYTLALPVAKNLPANYHVELMDALLGTSTDLTVTPAYTFTSTADYAGQRFTLRYTTAGRVTGTTANVAATVLTLYPNPASGEVRVLAAANTPVRVFDALGRLVHQTQTNAAGAELTVSLAGLKAGFYTVRAGAASRQLVVE